jgi:hypothetical protein
MPTNDERTLGLRTAYRLNNNLDARRAVVGDADGNYIWPQFPGYVIIREQTSNGLSVARPVLPPAGKTISLTAGTDVLLEVDQFGQLRIAEPDTKAAMSKGSNPIGAIVQPLPTMRTAQSEIETLAVLPTAPPSLNVIIKSWNPIIDNIAYQFPGALGNLTDYVPATDEMCYAVIFVKSDYATTEIFASTPRSVTDLPLDIDDIQECLDAKTAGSTPVYALTLVGDQSAITLNDILTKGVPLQQVVNTSEGSGTAIPPVVQGDLLYGSATNVLSTLPKSATATRYLSNTGTSNNPAWAQVNLASGVTGTLPIGNGGTGAVTALAAFNNLSPTTTRGDLITRDATNNIRLGIGTANKVLHSDGTDPSWQTITATDITLALASPPPIGSTTPNTGAFTTLASKVTDAATNTVTNVVTIGHNTSGTPLAGYGTSYTLQGQDSTTTDQDMARFRVEWTTPTHASRLANLILSLYPVGIENDALIIASDGSNYAKGLIWTPHVAVADANTWQSVAYGNGVYVAVAADGSIMSCFDGVNWTLRTSPAANSWTAVAFGNGIFVAVAKTGTGNRVVTSTDGITWTLQTSAVDSNWQDVAYGKGLFVAVASLGSGSRVMTSPNGVTWTAQTAVAANGWQGITFGNDLFVAVSNSGTGNRVMTSPDGAMWTSQVSAADNNWNSVVYGNGLFVAVADSGSGNRVMTSPDAITWTTQTSASNNNWTAVTYGNGLYVAVANSGIANRVMTSPNGATWTSRVSAADNPWNAVIYGNGIFVAVAQAGTSRVMTSGKAETTKPPNVHYQQGTTSFTDKIGINELNPQKALDVVGDVAVRGSITGALPGALSINANVPRMTVSSESPLVASVGDFWLDIS